MAGLPPPPLQDPQGSFGWLEWYRQLRDYLSTASSIPWNIIQFAGSKLTDIQSRLHGDLQAIQGGSPGERYHLTAAQLATVGTTPPIVAIAVTAPLTTTGGTSPSLGMVNQGTLTTLLHGNPTGNPTFGAVVEADMSLSNNTTNNATAARHGFLPILSNSSTQYLNGQGNFATPSGTTNSFTTQSFSAVTSVNVLHNFGVYPVVQIIDNTNEVLIPLSITHGTVNDFTVAFTAATTGNVIASVGSPQPQSVIVVAADYTVLTSDRIVKVTAAAKTITLPTSVGNTGREFAINNASTGNCFVVGTGGELISNEATQTLPSSSSMVVYADGTGYWII